MRNALPPAQLEANQRNALKSTGPSTSKGQAVFKIDACQHHIVSKETAVRGRCIKEEDQEFAVLHQQVCEELEPVRVATLRSRP